MAQERVKANSQAKHLITKWWDTIKKNYNKGNHLESAILIFAGFVVEKNKQNKQKKNKRKDSKDLK